MLEIFSIEGFKSLQSIKELQMPKMAVLFGPNAAGKSNFLEAVQTLSRIGTERTLSEALQYPIRGYPVESFSFPPGGLPDLLSQDYAKFTLDTVVKIEKDRYKYKVVVRIDPKSGSVAVENEYLASLTTSGAARGRALIELMEDKIHIRRKSKPAHPRTEPLGLNHTILSDPRLGGTEYRGIEKCRSELSGWHTYYLDPRTAMRRAATPAEVQDIGVLGENIAPFLYRLNAENPKAFNTVVRTLRTLIPSVDGLTVDLDKRRGTLDIVVRQNNIDYSSRIISEGTLRVLALCAIVVNPWGGSLLAFEEPENGVHPRRIELIADLLSSLVISQGRQLIVTTHSPLFCSMILKKARLNPNDIGLFNVQRTRTGTSLTSFDTNGPLFENDEIAKALSDRGEDGIFEGLILRGMFDG
jgi:predicted ATPase